MTVDEITKFIVSGNLSTEDMNYIVMAVNHARSFKRSEKRLELKKDMAVWFEHRGKKVFGSVSRLNPKTCKIAANDGLVWNVSYNLVNAV